MGTELEIPIENENPDEGGQTIDDLIGLTAPGADKDQPDGDEKPDEDKPPAEEKPAGELEIPDDLGLDTDDDEIIPEEELEIDPAIERSMTTAQANAMKSMRLKIKEQGIALAAKPVDTDLQTRLDAAESQIERENFAKSPRFAREHRAPLRALNQRIVAVGKEYGIEQKTLVAAMRLDRAACANLLGEEISNQHGLAELLPMYAEAKTRVAAADAAVKDFRASNVQLTADELATATTERETVIETARAALFDDGFTLLAASAKMPDWLPAIQAEAASILTGDVDQDKLASTALSGIVARHQVKHSANIINTLKSQNAELSKKLSKYVKLSPKVKGSKAPAPTKKAADSLDDLTAHLR